MNDLEILKEYLNTKPEIIFEKMSKECMAFTDACTKGALGFGGLGLVIRQDSNTLYSSFHFGQNSRIDDLMFLITYSSGLDACDINFLEMLVAVVTLKINSVNNFVTKLVTDNESVRYGLNNKSFKNFLLDSAMYWIKESNYFNDSVRIDTVENKIVDTLSRKLLVDIDCIPVSWTFINIENELVSALVFILNCIRRFKLRSFYDDNESIEQSSEEDYDWEL